MFITVPPEPDANYTSQITIDPYLARKTTNTATVLLPLFPDNAGTIRCYAIMVARMGFINSSYGRIDLNNGEWPFAATWFESKHEDFEIPYQAAKICNNSYSCEWAFFFFFLFIYLYLNNILMLLEFLK